MSIKRFDLHKDDYSKLHFDMHELENYLNKNINPASVPHRHSFYQIIWFTEPGKHYIDYQCIEHDAQTVFFIAPNQIHYFSRSVANQGYLFHFNDFFIQRFDPKLKDQLDISVFNELGNNHNILPSDLIDRLKSIAFYIQSELEKTQPHYQHILFHHFASFILYLLRIRSLSLEALPPITGDYELALRFNQLISNKTTQFEAIEAIAQELRTNTKKLSQVCKEYLKDTPARIIKTKKILEAKRMLSSPNMSVKEIAHILGFDQPTYFTKYFKKTTGLTPRQFQQTIRR